MSAAKVWDSIQDLSQHLDRIRDTTTIVCTSGGCDGLHLGHAQCIISSAELGKLVVIVNGDGFLIRKKGYAFMPLQERMEFVSYLRGVSHVVGWDDGTQYVDGALRLLRPHIFTKGGDYQSIDDVCEAERNVCTEIGCQIVCGIGGGKIQSSSAMQKRCAICLSLLQGKISNLSSTQK